MNPDNQLRTTSSHVAPARRQPTAALALGLTCLLANAPSAGLAQDIFAGRTVYEKNCANCHGIDGRATVPGTPDFYEGTGLYASDNDLINVVKYGKNLMPGYDQVLRDSEILNAIVYIRTLRR